MRHMSLTARISALFAFCAALVLIALGWSVVRSVETHFQEMDRAEIEGKLTLVRTLLERARTATELQAVPRLLEGALVGHHGLSVTLLAAEGSIWFSSPHGTHSLHGAHAPLPLGHLPYTEELTLWKHGGQSYRSLSAQVHPGVPGASALRVVITLDISHHRVFMDDFLRMLLLATALAALTTAALGWLATHMGLRPLRRISELVAHLSASSLHERLPESSVPGEIQQLTQAFNAMLTRLEASFRRLSEFSSDIAHELRTPVSNLMTQTQVILGWPRSVEEYRESLQSAAEEYERLGRMIGDMLFLAQADNQLIAPRSEPVDLADEAHALAEFHGIVAEEKGVQIHVAGVANLAGDRIMLRRALSNLLSNAIRHCPSGELVNIQLSASPREVTVTIDNPGEISQENLPRLFERFYTGEAARRPGGEGVGLGLAIVRSIIEIHGGTIAAANKNGRICFVIHLPAAVPNGTSGTQTD